MHIRGPIFFAGPRVAAFDSPIPPTVRSRFPERRPPPAMFESLGEKFDALLRKLRGQGKITERNIEEALRDVRLALLEADVNRSEEHTSELQSLTNLVCRLLLEKKKKKQKHKKTRQS